MATLPIGPHTSEYTNGELDAMLAHIIGVDPEDITGVAVVVDLGDRYSLGGTPSTDDAKFIIFKAIMSGLLEA